MANRSDSNRSSSGSQGRERIENPRTGPMNVTRDDQGQFDEVEQEGRSSGDGRSRDDTTDEQTGPNQQRSRNDEADRSSNRRSR